MHAEVFRIELSAATLKGLRPERRYVFALAGHVFNELILLQKWITLSRMAPGNEGPQADASVGVSMFLLRMLAAKTHEALHVLRKQSVDVILRADYFDRVAGLSARWDAVLDGFAALPWLGNMRNRGAFHYMNAAQWTPHLDDAFCEGAYLYIGKRYADTYFHWSEMGAALPAMRAVNPNDPMEGLAQMLAELGALLAEVTDCLARGLQAFINAEHLGGEKSQPIRFDAPPLEPPALHYFFADERLA